MTDSDSILGIEVCTTLLAAMGLYGLCAWAVRRGKRNRRRYHVEIGFRMCKPQEDIK